MPRGRRNTPKVQAFLAAIRETPSVSMAARAARIERGMHYRRLAKDPAYKTAFERAWAEGVRSFEDAAVARAQFGVEEPVTYKGELIYPKDHKGRKAKKPLMIRRYPEGLTQFLLRGALPEKYRDVTEHVGKGGGPIQVANVADVLRARRRRLQEQKAA